MPSRYQPLADYLAGLPAGTAHVTLTFAAIEAILGVPLPASAGVRSWWTGRSERDAHRRAWRAVGWSVAAVTLRHGVEAVTFTRIDAAREPTAPSG